MSDVVIEILKGIVSVFILALPIFIVLLFIFAWQNRRKANYLEKNEYTVLQLKIPKTNDKTPTAAEMMFATLHGILRPKFEIVRQGKIQEHLSFEMVADATSIRFYVWTPRHLKDFVEGQIYAQYPSAEITEIEDYSLKDPEGGHHHIAASEIVLTKSDVLPIKTFNNFTVDPLAGITGVLSKLEKGNEEIWIQILAKPESEEWKRKSLDWISKKKTGRIVYSGPVRLVIDMFNAVIFGPPGATVPGVDKVVVSTEDEGRFASVEEKAEKLGYMVKIRMIYRGEEQHLVNERLNAVFGAFKQFNTTNLNGFKGRRLYNSRAAYSDYRNRLFQSRMFDSKGFHLNIEELASIYHLPHTSVETPNINWTTSKTGEPPTTLPDQSNTEGIDLTLFGETNFRSHKQIFGIKRDDRRRHMYIIGKSGMGKTKLLENLINDDIIKGEGVAVMDPHGDLIMDTLKKIPSERIKDVIVFDPSDREFPIAYNPMEVVDESLKIQIASGIVGTFKKIFGFSWGPRLEYVLNYTVLALLDTDGSTLLGVVQMLTDKNFRKKIVDNIQDPVVKKFWTTEFASYSEKFATEAIAPILNKVGQFTANSLIRNIIGQPYSTFNIRKLMDEGKIFLVNLSTGRVGETNASLLGSLMITSIQLAAMSRADIPEEERKDFFLYVDEFQNFATESFENILSEARKYRLSLIMANQYIAQMDEKVREAVFGNVGTLVTFRVGAGDASVLEKEYNPPFESQDLINLPRQHVYIRMTIEGMSEPAFSAKTLTITSDTTGNVKEIVTNSREKYTHPRDSVEKDVAKWAGIIIEAMNPKNTSSPETPEKPRESQSSGDTSFEAPLVRKAGKKGHRTGQADAVKEAIAESTAHINKPEPSVEKPHHEEPKIAPAPLKEIEGKGEEPVKIKDKIDKEVLSDILKMVVEPKGAAAEEKKPARTEVHSGGENNKNESDEKKSDDREEPKAKHPVKNDEDKTEPQFPSSLKEKERVITPKNFKKVKAIHPHEVVKIMESSKQPHNIKEGEVIKFN